MPYAGNGCDRCGGHSCFELFGNTFWCPCSLPGGGDKGSWWDQLVYRICWPIALRFGTPDH